MPPYMRLLGFKDTIISLNQNLEFPKPPVYVKDETDAGLGWKESSNFNKDSVGVYYMRYTATDQRGNSNTVSRKITVVNESDNYTGTFTATLSSNQSTDTLRFTEIVSHSNTKNLSINFNNFHGINANKVAANIYYSGVDTLISIPGQIRNSENPAFAQKSYYGSGRITNKGNRYQLNYAVLYKDTAVVNPPRDSVAYVNVILIKK